MRQSTPLWETEGEQKREAVQSLFARIASDYDRANRLLSFNRDRSWRNLAVQKLNLQPGDRALDLCCGTGDFLLPLRQAVGTSGNLTGLDFCEPMLRQASAKDESSHLVLGDATNLPFQAEEFHAITIGWGIRNVPNIDQAHQEAFRVLKRGGRFVSLDCAEPRNSIIRVTTRFGRSALTKLLGSAFHARQEYSYLDESSKRFRSREELADSMRAAGFTSVQFQDLMLGNICIHWGTKP